MNLRPAHLKRVKSNVEVAKWLAATVRQLGQFIRDHTREGQKPSSSDEVETCVLNMTELVPPFRWNVEAPEFSR